MSAKSCIFIFTVLAAIWQGCANPISPTGGPKDVTPPRLDTTLSTPNRQTFFREREIILHFDEWIQLDNIFNQLVVSPPLEFRPEIKARGKELLFRFDEREVLRDSMTYTINFGNAVKDQTEGNKAGDLRFVFSTGPVIDSLFLRGKLVNAFTNEAESEVPVLLYSAGADSVVAKEKPLYFSTSNKNGEFSLENLREGKYILFALKDLNNNLQYDVTGEALAFSDGWVEITDSTFSSPLLRLSTADAPVPVTGTRSPDSISLIIGFSSPPVMDVMVTNMPDSGTYYFPENDSLRIWVSSPDMIPDSLIIVQGDEKPDTIGVAKKQPGLKGLRFVAPAARMAMAPQREIRTEWNQPVLLADEQLVRLIDTSGAFIPITIERDTDDLRTITLNARLQEALTYQLEFLPGSVTHWNSVLLQDTLRSDIRIGKRADFGRLTLDIQNLEPGTSYVMEVLFKETQPVYRGSIGGTADVHSIDLDGYTPGNYSIRVIVDLNGNGRWDPANYWEGTQPEPVFTIPLGELRANWELKLDVPIPAGN